MASDVKEAVSAADRPVSNDVGFGVADGDAHPETLELRVPKGEAHPFGRQGVDEAFGDLS